MEEKDNEEEKVEDTDREDEAPYDRVRANKWPVAKLKDSNEDK